MQKEAWEEVCNRYVIKKAKYERHCEELRRAGTKVRDLPPKPKRCLQKEVFDEVREKWVRDLEIDEDQMEVDGAVSKFDDNCLVEVSPFHEEDGGMSSCWGTGGEDGEDEGAGEDLMDINKL